MGAASGKSEATASPMVAVSMAAAFGGQIGGVLVDGDRPGAVVLDLGAGTSVAAGIEWSNGGRLWFGPGVSVLELPDPFARGESERTVTTFDFRGRATIAVSLNWSVDLLAAVGPARWGDDGSGGLWGWAYRIGGGASWQVQTGLTLTAALERWRADVGNRDGLFSDEFTQNQPLAASSWLLSIGARLW